MKRLGILRTPWKAVGNSPVSYNKNNAFNCGCGDGCLRRENQFKIVMKLQCLPRKSNYHERQSKQKIHYSISHKICFSKLLTNTKQSKQCEATTLQNLL